MLVEKLKPIIVRYEEITQLLSSQEIINDIKALTTLSKEQSDIAPIASSAKEYIATLEGIEENKILLEDKELGELAKEELKSLEERKLELEEEI
ncbi:PCRF domain-containing protein, partial [uncultured Helicobacter sp.]|uniref:PCRF domain-containing protein n=1 Tax=uncultured Helicobacter sp. TaxID=175537 RepID=UPI0026090013